MGDITMANKALWHSINAKLTTEERSQLNKWVANLYEMLDQARDVIRTTSDHTTSDLAAIDIAVAIVSAIPRMEE